MTANGAEEEIFWQVIGTFLKREKHTKKCTQISCELSDEEQKEDRQHI